MKIYRNRHIPLKGFSAINLFGFLLVHPGVFLSNRLINHERIHTAQMREMGYVFFYLFYFTEWLIRIPMKGNAYRNISFEREAYDRENEANYLRNRRHYAFFRYMRKKNKMTS